MLKTDKNNQNMAIADLLKEMEIIAARIRALIVEMPAKDLLGYIYSQYTMLMIAGSDTDLEASNTDRSDDAFNEIQFLLEYVHAVLASDKSPAQVEFDEAQSAELFMLSKELRKKAMLFAMASSVDTDNEHFGPDTADIEFHTKSSWVLLRGNRYQVLEGEFYRYVLAPHDDVLKEVYGVGAAEIAEGFQDMANAIRTGQVTAIEELMKQYAAANDFAVEQEKPLAEVMERWGTENTDQLKASGLAMDDLLRGGIANVSRHTKLPPDLLADLAYQRGEETEFFAEGDFSGTPFRTLPARKKPLIQLGSDYYTIDPCFIRDSGYRALLFNLLQRKPDYKKSFEDRQKIMSEGAFPDILTDQLPGAKVYKEVYYKDPVTNQWSESDTLVLVDDVLYLVEAKAGAAATIASPAIDFNRHAQSVQDLVLKAYKQCLRFFDYLNSADEVALYNQVNGKYVECGRVRLSDYRVMLPIGLTVESFTPFSTFCKDLPEVEPILENHAFLSMSIDDLFVLKRFLTTPGVFAHYMEVRQAAAGLRHAHLFDEFDHLGAYITRNRFDQDLENQLKDGEANLLVWDGMSNVVDRMFEGSNWETNTLPTQEFPEKVSMLLGALDNTREPGWLSVESLIRDYGDQARNNMNTWLSDLGETLDQNPTRYFILGDEGQALFVWMQNSTYSIDWEKINIKASAAALSAEPNKVTGVLIEITKGGAYEHALQFKVNKPSEQTDENKHIFDEARHMSQQMRMAYLPADRAVASKVKGGKKIGRNELCPCGSGKKYKRCHGQ
ncbi:MAG: SEC-C domain-containing protein [Candidatus Thiodiazotropha taylori]